MAVPISSADRVPPRSRRRRARDHAAHARDLHHRPGQPVRDRPDPRRADRARRARRPPRLAAHPRRHPRAAGARPRRSVCVAACAGLTDNAVAAMSVSHCYGMAGARIGFLGGPPGFVRGCLQLKAALTRLNTNLISQHGALAALADESYLARAEPRSSRTSRHLEADARRRRRRAVGRPAPARARVRGRRVGDRRERPGADGRAVRPPRRRLSGRRPRRDRRRERRSGSISRGRTTWAMEHLREVLADAVAEAASGAGGTRGVAARRQGHRAGGAARRGRSARPGGRNPMEPNQPERGAP